MKEKIRQALSARKKLHISDKSLNEAAVVLPIFYRNGEYHILFTRRSNQVPHHKGQVSFPGGGRHESDHNLMETALREAWEEVGLEPKDVEILGELDDTCTATSGFVISPFVAFIPYPYEFKVSHDEIDEIFDMPISTLLYKADVKKEHYAVGDKLLTAYSYEYGGRVIWGATAGILRQFLEIWQSASGAHT
jgi:8-oxo-dGTP pyrophosphatase MutT (NUDIX family)